MTLATQLVLMQPHLAMRKPALVRSRNWNHPAVCARCGNFSLRTGRLYLPGKSLPGLPRKKAPKSRLCENCIPTSEVILKHRPANRMTPTLAVQMLGFGCPLAYQLRKEHPCQPSSPGNAFGTVYHLARQLSEQKSLSEVGFFRTRWGLSNILGKFTDEKFFRHRIGTQNDWEIPTMRYYLEQVIRFLWHHHQMVSVKAYGEALARSGTKLVWWDAEMRLPVIDLNWLLSGTGLTMTEGEKWGLNGAVDLVILTEHDGQYSVRIIDHKVTGIDIHSELDHQDCQLQLALYASWAMQAFSGLGIKAENVSLWVHRLTLNPMRLEKIPIPFDSRLWKETLVSLKLAIATYQKYQREGFPARPSEWQCPGCDFAFANHLCPKSVAQPGMWNLGVPYVPVGSQRIKTPKVNTGLGQCPFCHAPMKMGRRMTVCSNPAFDDCPREDR
ncbi:MAG: hypothetical protein AAB486_00925 [Patescibacteria group bacterium]